MPCWKLNQVLGACWASTVLSYFPRPHRSFCYSNWSRCCDSENYIYCTAAMDTFLSDPHGGSFLPIQFFSKTPSHKLDMVPPTLKSKQPGRWDKRIDNFEAIWGYIVNSRWSWATEQGSLKNKIVMFGSTHLSFLQVLICAFCKCSPALPAITCASCKYTHLHFGGRGKRMGSSSAIPTLSSRPAWVTKGPNLNQNQNQGPQKWLSCLLLSLMA